VTRNRFLGAIYVENGSEPGCFQKADLELLTLFGNQAAFAIENALLYEDLQVSFYETVRSLTNALEAKDKYTRGHSDRVARYAVAIGKGLGLSAEKLETLRTAAELHDIGKIAIGEAIISKKDRLSDEEYELVKQHPQRGVEILRPIRFLQPVLPFILHHHERFNGRGYPEGLRGQNIPLEARILNLADAFDAMTTQRPYNTPKTFAEALAQCRKEAGVSFDAECVKALVEFVEKQEKTDREVVEAVGEPVTAGAT
jgi:putative nucleotidyltransferase with HDIG domain